MICKSVPVKNNGLYSLCNSALGQKCADLLGACDLWHILIALERLFKRRGANKSAMYLVIDDLTGNVTVALKNAQARARIGTGKVPSDPFFPS